MRGLILKGSRNIFTVRTDEGRILECRIKGKILRGAEGFYNILAPGDLVELDETDSGEGTAAILSFYPRRNAFVRLNQKGVASKRARLSRQQSRKLEGPDSQAEAVELGAPQLLAANLDLVLCVTSAAMPPWRPRFLDRLLLQADICGIPPVIVLNKTDLIEGLGEDSLDLEERLSDFEALGYTVYRVSGLSGLGLGPDEPLPRLLRGRRSLLSGQSGVGKSSIINWLLPSLQQRTGEINEKYMRGNHTTSQGVLLEDNSIALIDSPGIRVLLPWGCTADDLILHLREFAPLYGTCSYGLSCTHQTEPGCKILEALNAGYIHEDRYESFMRLREELKEAENERNNKRRT
jgi:ribosome biogenesis GTPase